jgi:hypothetical protein
MLLAWLQVLSVSNAASLELHVSKRVIQVYTNKSRVMPFIPTESVACMSTSWLLGDIYTANSCRGKKRDLDALKFGLLSWGRQPWWKTSALQVSCVLGVGLTMPSWKRLVTKSEEAVAGSLAGRSFWGRPGPTQGCGTNYDDEKSHK